MSSMGSKHAGETEFILHLSLLFRSFQLGEARTKGNEQWYSYREKVHRGKYYSIKEGGGLFGRSIALKEVISYDLY